MRSSGGPLEIWAEETHSTGSENSEATLLTWHAWVSTTGCPSLGGTLTLVCLPRSWYRALHISLSNPLIALFMALVLGTQLSQQVYQLRLSSAAATVHLIRGLSEYTAFESPFAQASWKLQIMGRLLERLLVGGQGHFVLSSMRAPDYSLLRSKMANTLRAIRHLGWVICRGGKKCAKFYVLQESSIIRTWIRLCHMCSLIPSL